MSRPYGKPLVTRRSWARLAVACSLVAVVLSGAALAVALNRPPTPAWPLVCSQSFTDAQTGATQPIWYPCSARRPTP